MGRFIESLYALGGYVTWKEFAEDAGISAPQVSDFKNGSVEPSGLNLLKLIQAAARRGEGDDAFVATSSVPPVGPLSGIEEGISRLLAGQLRLAEEIGLDVTRWPEQASPKKKRSGKAMFL